MKKVILGTTALVAATALTAGTASAAEKIKLNLGGYLQTSFVAADYDTGDQLPTDIRHEGEVHFTGSTTLDNGLKFGVNIQLEARTTGDQVDETYMFVEGSFGRINIGSENSAAYLMHYGSPEPVVAWTLNDSNADASGFTTPATSPTEVSDADKITYFTPRFAGFQIGASYTPDGDEETGTGASPYAAIADEGLADEAYSVGVNYINKFNGVSVKASLGYDYISRDADSTSSTTTSSVIGGADGTAATVTTTDGAVSTATTVVGTAIAGSTSFVNETTVVTTTARDDTSEFDAGLTLGFGGFSVGGAYKYTDNDAGIEDVERHDWNVGVTYGQGPWKIGVQYAGVSLDDNSDGELHAVVVGGQYVLGPGITAFGGVQFWDAEDDLV
ncbi:MAG: porin, partial [Sneathiella sp.]